MKTDTEIVNWIERNMARLLVIRGKFGVLRFKWGWRDESGAYEYHPISHGELRVCVSEAIEHDEKKINEQLDRRKKAAA